MSLTIDGRILADVDAQGVNLRPVLGAYELVFALYLRVAADPEDKIRRASIHGARVKVGSGSELKDLGFARPEGPFEIRTHPHQSNQGASLALAVQPSQIAALEALRDAGDLSFELQVLGMGAQAVCETLPIHDTLRVYVAQSDWIGTLRSAGARDHLLLEVPIPLEAPSEQWRHAIESFRQAEQHYRHGDYHACVNACRTVIQELGALRFDNEEWSNAKLGLFEPSRRNDLDKAERESGVWAAIRHYTHLSHHGESEGGAYNYSRDEAQLILTLAAAFARHVQAR